MKCPCSCHKTSLALFLVRLGVVLLFLIPGIQKLMDSAAFQAALGNMLGLTGTIGLVAAWLVIAFEVLGSIFILLGKLLPFQLYKISVLGLLVISLVIIFGVHLQAENIDIMKVLFMVLPTFALIGLFVTKPMCPIGITGDGDAGSCSL